MDWAAFRNGRYPMLAVIANAWFCLDTEVELFTRDYGTLTIGSSFREGRGLAALELDLGNKLVLCVVAGLKAGEMAKRVRQWFVNTCQTHRADNDLGYLPYTVDCLDTGRNHHENENLVGRLDLDITRLSVSEAHPLLYYNEPEGSMSVNNRGTKEHRTHHAILNDDDRVVDEADFRAKTMVRSITSGAFLIVIDFRQTISTTRLQS